MRPRPPYDFRRGAFGLHDPRGLLRRYRRLYFARMELASGLSGFLSIGLPALMLFFVGLAIGRALGSHAQGTTLARLQAEMRSHDVEFMQLRRTAEKLRAEKQTFNSFLVHMSEFAREINTELDRRKLAQLVLRIVDKMFQARQILIFYMSEDGTQLR